MGMKEIVTKAVIGKGKKDFKKTYQIEVENVPSTVLGCWIINHNFSGKEVNNKININGSFDVNVWYSYQNDTKTMVTTKKISYEDTEEINEKNSTEGAKDIIIRSLKQPVCVKAINDGNKIDLDIEYTLGIEVIGDAKVRISELDSVDDWEDLNKEEKDKVSEDNNMNINQQYINDNKIK